MPEDIPQDVEVHAEVFLTSDIPGDIELAVADTSRDYPRTAAKDVRLQLEEPEGFG